MIPRRLTENYSITFFDCGNDDLNDFLLKDAIPHSKELLAVTYIVEENNKIAAFFSLLNDNISADDTDHKRKFKKVFPEGKSYKFYPAVKIGRLGVNSSYQKNGLGTMILDFIKLWFVDKNKTGCRFITVDAYNNDKSLNFYLTNGFNYFTDDDKSEETRSMYYDLIEIINRDDKTI
jgi:GNAT superfamily N-acetyltransferase